LSAGISIFTIVEDRTMQWITPAFEEIDLGCEINTYANAEL
jgi:coenzyme PQQ precursor peptide PqqA